MCEQHAFGVEVVPEVKMISTSVLSSTPSRGMARRSENAIVSLSSSKIRRGIFKRSAKRSAENTSLPATIRFA